MTKKELFEKIEQLLPILQQYQITKEHVNLDAQKPLMMELSAEITPGDTTTCWTCPASVLAKLNVFASYYRREYPRWKAQQTQLPVYELKINTDEDMVASALSIVGEPEVLNPAPKKKGGRPSKKK